MEALRDRVYNYTFSVFIYLNGTAGNRIHACRALIIFGFSTSLFTAGICFQVLYFFRNGMKFHIFINIAPTVSILLLCVIVMCLFYVKRRNIEMVFLFLRDDWELQRNREEIRIKKRFENYAKTYTTCNWLWGTVTVTMVILPSLLPPILDYVQPVNASRPRKHPFLSDCLVNPDEYYYSILLLESLISYLSIAIALLCLNMSVSLMNHICGMLTVLGHRLENLEKLTDRNITSFVKEHQRVIKFISLINSVGNEYLFLFLALTIGTLGFSLAEVINVELINIRSITLTISHLVQFFVSNYMGQKVIDLSTEVSIGVYNTRWYESQTCQRKLLLFIIMRTRKPCALTTVRMYTLSLQNYAWVMRCAISYCMIISKVE